MRNAENWFWLEVWTKPLSVLQESGGLGAWAHINHLWKSKIYTSHCLPKLEQNCLQELQNWEVYTVAGIILYLKSVVTHGKDCSFCASAVCVNITKTAWCMDLPLLKKKKKKIQRLCNVITLLISMQSSGQYHKHWQIALLSTTVLDRGLERGIQKLLFTPIDHLMKVEVRPSQAIAFYETFQIIPCIMQIPWCFAVDITVLHIAHIR